VKLKRKWILLVSIVIFIGVLLAAHVVAGEKYQFLKTGMVNVLDFGAVPNDKLDDTTAIQSAISYVMQNGGGTVYIPSGDYEILGTLYTHQDNYSANANLSPLEIRGETPINADLYNSDSKNVTRLIKRNEGNILSVNFTATKESVIPSVYRNISVRNIGFYGSGTYDKTYPKVMESTKAVVGIEMRNAGITVEDSIFWALSKGIAAPDKVSGVDNYSDQNIFRHLGFFNIGHTWIELQRSDATTLEHITGYDMARNSQYGIRARKGESFSIKEVLVAGKAMHLSKNFKLIALEHTNNVSISSVYAERVEGTLIQLTNATNTDIKGVGVRHYGNTYIKGEGARNVEIKNVYAHVEEGKVLSSEDDGTYEKYNDIPTPLDFAFDSASSNITIGSTVFANGIHIAGEPFVESSVRYYPLMNKDATSVQGIEQTNFVFYYDTATQKIRAKVNGKVVNTETTYGFTYTYNESTGILKFSKTGLLSQFPSLLVSNRMASDGTLNVPYLMSNDVPQVKLLTVTNTPVPLTSVSFSMDARF